MADTTSVSACKRGEVLLPFGNSNIRLEHVLYIPVLGYSLVSVGRLSDNCVESFFRSDDVELRHQLSNMLVGYGICDNESILYALPNPMGTLHHTISSTREAFVQLWHNRMEHMNPKDLCNVHKRSDGVPKLGILNQICRACRMGKSHKLPLKVKFKRATTIGEIVHSYIVGSLEPSYPG